MLAAAYDARGPKLNQKSRATTSIAPPTQIHAQTQSRALDLPLRARCGSTGVTSLRMVLAFAVPRKGRLG